MRDAVDDEVAELDVDDDEREMIVDSRLEKAWEALSPWVRYQECVTLEFDTEAGTATILRK